MNTNNEFTRKPDSSSVDQIKYENVFPSEGYNKYTRPLNAEELKELQDCSKHAVWYFGLPSAIMVTGANLFTSTKTPFPLPNVFSSNFGKLLGSLVFTWCITTSLYMPVCYDRTSKLYNSNLKKEERERQQQRYIDADVNEPGTDYQGSLDSKFDGPDSRFSHLNVDSSYNSESYRGDSMISENDRSKSDKLIPEVSYEELRRRNRGNIYSKTLRPSNENSNDSGAKIEPLAEKVSPEPSPELQKRVKKNKYGDDVEF